MAKHLANRIVLGIQFLCWFAVSCLLFQRGFINIQQKSVNQNQFSRSNVSDNSTAGDNGPPSQNQAGRGVFAGFVMITVAAIMLVISPVFIVLKLLENRRRHQRMLKALELDQPPKYEDVVESAPRYSTLFNFSDNGDFSVDDGKRKMVETKIQIIVKPEQVPLHSVTE